MSHVSTSFFLSFGATGSQVPLIVTVETWVSLMDAFTIKDVVLFILMEVTDAQTSAGQASRLPVGK